MMGLSTRFLRIPRPETFLYVMSLQTGASLITLSLLLNKISGLYGLLALLTGYHLSPVQLSMYLYSLIALAITVLLFPHIRKQSPLQCLALAWLYVIDSAINAAYTAAFGVTWFLVIGQHTDSDNAKASGPGSDTMGQTAGFTGSEYDTTTRSAARGERSADQLGDAVTQPESFESILFICALWSIRLYFVFVMLAFARHALRLYIAMPRHTQLPTHSRNTSAASMASVADIDREPFSPYSPDGQGWQGKLGRLMISVGRNYWLGDEDDGTWVNMSHRFHTRGEPTAGPPGPIERERRRRSGTGPPQPSQAAVQAAALQQPARELTPGPRLTVKVQDWDERTRTGDLKLHLLVAFSIFLLPTYTAYLVCDFGFICRDDIYSLVGNRTVDYVAGTLDRSVPSAVHHGHNSWEGEGVGSQVHKIFGARVVAPF